MNSSELAEKILEWRKRRLALNELEEEIKAAVLETQKTVVLGGVRVRYSNPRKSYDYETPGRAAPLYVIDRHTKTVTTTDWRAVCKDINVSGVVSSIGNPSVKIVLEE